MLRVNTSDNAWVDRVRVDAIHARPFMLVVCGESTHKWTLRNVPKCPIRSGFVTEMVILQQVVVNNSLFGSLGAVLVTDDA